MKKEVLFAVLFINIFSAFSQNTDKAERFALKCLNTKLEKANKDIDYLLNMNDEYNFMLMDMEVEKFEVIRKQVDSILTVAGLYEHKHLNVSLMYECMTAAYNPEKNKNDSTAYQMLLEHLYLYISNPEIMYQTSTSLQLEALKIIFTPDVAEKEFYTVYRFLLFQGITNEFANYAEKQMEQDQMFASKQSDEQGEVEYISIVDDNTDIYSQYNNEEVIEVFQIIDDKIAIEEPDKIKSEPEKLHIIDDDIEIVEEMEIIIPEEEPKQQEYYYYVDKMPEFPGGKEALKEYLTIKNKQVEGKVFVQFTIDKTGKVSKPVIVRGLNTEMDKKAFNLIHEMPDWIPGENNGKTENVVLTYPVIISKK